MLSVSKEEIKLNCVHIRVSSYHMIMENHVNARSKYVWGTVCMAFWKGGVQRLVPLEGIIRCWSW